MTTNLLRISLPVVFAAAGAAVLAQAPTGPATRTTTAASDDLYKAKPGPFTVKVVDQDWRDEARKRDVPVRVYLPEAKGGDQETATKHPLIVMSHGLGGSRTTYPYLGQHLASHGYIVIAPTHAGSDTRSFVDQMREGGGEKSRGWLTGSISDQANLENRPLDVTFILDVVAHREPVEGQVDLDHIGVIGHSFGAYTAMTIGGATVDLAAAKSTSFRDARVKAVLAMSPEGPGTMGLTPKSWDGLAVPVLFLTGTRDYGQGQRSAGWRRAGFEHTTGVDDWLVTLEGAGHMTFADLAGSGKTEGEDDQDAAKSRLRERIRERILEAAGGNDSADPAQHEHHVAMIKSLAVAFLDAYVCGDAKAKAWLAAWSASKHDDCKAEFKPAKAPSVPGKG